MYIFTEDSFPAHLLTTKVHSLVAVSFLLRPCLQQATFSLAVTDGLRYCRSPLTPSVREVGASRSAGVSPQAARHLGTGHESSQPHSDSQPPELWN